MRRSLLSRRSSHYRLSYFDVLKVHEEIEKIEPCRPGILNETALLGALARPYCGYYRAIHQKAAVILHGIACSHGFVDGNKRTAVLSAYVLIKASGYRLHAIEGELLTAQLTELVLDLVERKRSLEEAMEWMRLRIGRRT